MIASVGGAQGYADWSDPDHRLRRLLAEFIGMAGLTFVLSGGAAIRRGAAPGVRPPARRRPATARPAQRRPPVPHAEISARLGIPAESIGPHRRRCLDKLRCDPAIARLINAEAATGR